MSTSYSTAIRNSRLNLLVTALGSAGHLLIYAGTEPAMTAAGTASGAVLLVSLPLSNPAAPGASGGVQTFSTITPTVAVASGSPTFFRMIDGSVDDGTHTQYRGDAGVGSGTLSVNSPISIGGTVSVPSAVITEGNP